MSERWAVMGEQEQEPWIATAWRWLAGTGRPALGWVVLLAVAGLAAMPATAVFASRWLPPGRHEVALSILGPLAVFVLWLLLGWRERERRVGVIRVAIISILYIFLGAFVITQLLSPWLPALNTVWAALQLRDVAIITAEVAGNWTRLLGRFALWGAGVAADAAPRDSLVLATAIAAVTWLLAGGAVLLARATRRGLIAAMPILWFVGLLILYGPADRWVFLVALGLTLILHLSLNQQRLVASWRRRNLDYSPSLFVEQNGLALVGIALLLSAALLVPNLYIYEITAQYYSLIRPLNNSIEATVDRLFPGLTGGATPWSGAGSAGGLPNEFLLGAGQEAMQRVVMRVRTDEPAPFYDVPPQSHNLRGATYSAYDGRGWDNPASATSKTYDAETPWSDTLSTSDRRILLQSIALESPSSILFAAGEPLAPSVIYAAEVRSADDLVALSSPARSYTVQSAIPARSEAELMALPWWNDANPLPPAYAIHLELPASVPERTRALARQLTAEAASPYAAATAIERYLRTFPYDLSVAAPPPAVVDVADYFLFDLQRGYCDYYATAFVVLARAAGLPARFATGFAAGAWSAQEWQWVISEAQAHSWPEVFFPEVGWVAFEPTAAQPLPLRIGQPAAIATDGPQPAAPFEPLASSPEANYGWIAVLAALAVFGLFVAGRFLRRGDDPWLALLAWGAKAGKPLDQGETPLEYGARLAAVVQTSEAERNPELGRIVSRELRALGDAVSAVHYAPAAARAEPLRQIQVRWQRLRAYLKQVKLRQ